MIGSWRQRIIELWEHWIYRFLHPLLRSNFRLPAIYGCLISKNPLPAIFGKVFLNQHWKFSLSQKSMWLIRWVTISTRIEGTWPWWPTWPTFARGTDLQLAMAVCFAESVTTWVFPLLGRCSIFHRNEENRAQNHMIYHQSPHSLATVSWGRFRHLRQLATRCCRSSGDGGTPRKSASLQVN